MIHVKIEEAQKQLPELLSRVRAGEPVEIHPTAGEAFMLVAVPSNLNGRAAWPGYPKAGSHKGKIWMADDFDEPFAELQEYME